MNDEKKNKRDFINEVMIGTRKTTLKEFFTDPDDLLQFTESFVNCLTDMDFPKIRKAMKALHWTWAHWVDENCNDRYNRVPDVYALRRWVCDLVMNTVKRIIDSEDCKDEYYTSCGGFEISFRLYDCPDEPDDFDHRVLFSVKFVLTEFDTSI